MERIMILILALFGAPHAFAAEEVEPWVVGLYEAQQLNEIDPVDFMRGSVIKDLIIGGKCAG